MIIKWHLLGIKFICALAASFVPLRRSGANDAIRATNKQYALQKSYDFPIVQLVCGIL